MKPKLVASLASAMVTLMFVSTLAVLPAARAVPNIYITPASVPTTTPSIGMKFNVTVWVTGWSGVFAYQVKFIIVNPAAGVIVTRAWEPAYSDPQWIFYTRPTIRPVSPGKRMRPRTRRDAGRIG